ncbi:Ig-like domain-containing protein [Cohnella soli]|uniref:Ig-like domain-containing protein n=1 Tax=Cohnella soli TaxID=425005 RepID=A0ABW0HMD7_9BACL
MTQNYTGYLYSGGYNYYYSYTVTINYLENSSPQFDLSLPKENTIVSNQPGYNTLTIKGIINKPDAGDTVTVKYKIDNQVTASNVQTLTTTGGMQAFGPLTLNADPSWTEGNHTLSVWSEDQLGAKSNVIARTFNYDKTAPAAPLGLKSPRQNVTSLDLAWDPSADADAVDYQVYQDGQLLGRSNGITSFPVNGLIENRTYSFTVKSIDRGGNISAMSSPLSVATVPWDGTPDTQPPSVPTSITATNVTFDSAQLQWAPSTDNFGVMVYEIYDAATSSLLGTSTRPVFNLNHLESDQTYLIRIIAKDAAGNASAASSEYSFRTTVYPLSLQSSFPSSGSQQVPLDTMINLKFNQPVSIMPGPSEITLSSRGEKVQVSITAEGSNIKIIPQQLLMPDTSYVVKIPLEWGTLGLAFRTESNGEQRNLVLNGGFESENATTPGVGDSWVSATNNTYGWQTASDAINGAYAGLSGQPHSGTYAQQLKLMDAPAGDIAEVTQQVSIGGSMPFHFESQVKLSQSIGSKASIIVEWLNSENVLLDTLTQDVTTVGGAYIPISVDAVTPVGTSAAKVHLRLASTAANGQGSAEFDDIVLKLPDNHKPVASLISPNGTASVPTIVTQTSPTIQWNQSDADSGTVFMKYQVQAWDSGLTSLKYDSGAVSYAGIGNQGVHTIDSSLKRNQDYQVRVRVFDGINWSAWSAPGWLRIQDAQEPNDTPAQASAAQAFTVYSGTIESATDIDYYKFTPQFTGLYHLTVKVPAGANYAVAILDAAQNTIAVGNQPAGEAKELSFRATAGATYYIKLSGVNGDFSLKPYTLGISRVLYNYQYDAAGRLKMMNVQKGLHLYMAEYKYDLNGNQTDTDYQTIEVDE